MWTFRDGKWHRVTISFDGKEFGTPCRRLALKVYAAAPRSETCTVDECAAHEAPTPKKGPREAA